MGYAMPVAVVTTYPDQKEKKTSKPKAKKDDTAIEPCFSAAANVSDTQNEEEDASTSLNIQLEVETEEIAPITKHPQARVIDMRVPE